MYNFSFSTHNEQLLLVTFCDTTAGIEASFKAHPQTNGQHMDGYADMEVEIDFKYLSL